MMKALSQSGSMHEVLGLGETKNGALHFLHKRFSHFRKEELCESIELNMIHS